MKQITILFMLLHHFIITMAQDTIFAKGGTCLYKISDHWKQCMEQQNARLTYDRDNLEPIYTRAALTDSVNRISCCAHYDFLRCIEKAANEHCPNDRRDMIAYSRQLGSAVPPDICQEQYPRSQCEKSSYFSGATKSICHTSIFMLIVSLVLVVFMVNHWVWHQI